MLLLTLLAMKKATSSGSVTPSRFRLRLMDRHLRLKVGRFDIGNQAPLEPGVQSFLERRYLPRGTV
jgi:hypothetical protein